MIAISLKQVGYEIRSGDQFKEKFPNPANITTTLLSKVQGDAA